MRTPPPGTHSGGRAHPRRRHGTLGDTQRFDAHARLTLSYNGAAAGVSCARGRTTVRCDEESRADDGSIGGAHACGKSWAESILSAHPGPSAAGPIDDMATEGGDLFGR